MIKAGSISDAETGESNAIPLVRMHSPATEHVFQQCSDIGALIFVVPTVDTVQQAQEAAKWVRTRPSSSCAGPPAPVELGTRPSSSRCGTRPSRGAPPAAASTAASGGTTTPTPITITAS